MSKQNRQARAAAAIAQQKRAERNRRLGITGAIVVVVAAVVAGLVWYSLGGSSSDSAVAGAASAKVDDTSLVVGPDSAKTKVTIYEDFQCPYCRQFESQSRDFLREAASDGKAQITYKPFNLLTQDDYSARALSAFATVLDDGTAKQALAFHDKLFDEQPYENASDKPDTTQLRDWAKDSGVTKASVLDAIGPVDKSYVTKVTQAAVGAGVQGTPTILVDGKPLSGSSISDQADQLEEMIKKS
ncbi:hypothetical protein GCM10011519_34620 [Marmoricola endophyticus]|uniref:Thioredoxin-like fold domain-containing protein n=1 Tax=Marmoricola endophyticus TaxID=2040280 RepID=A0A917BW02_9ACTN|nr:thioredoxin domain-containing protein [Marmoricola endophyticus]GGF57797.1 hypothetical protein GCM10011519_34620 [Marmoricola endophyticus]